MIRISNVSKSYSKGIKAVDNLNLVVEDGEIVAFVGPNGAGKSSTIKMLTGIIKPDNGEIHIGEYDIRKEGLKAKENIGYIADNPDMFLRLKGIEFLNLIAVL